MNYRRKMGPGRWRLTTHIDDHITRMMVVSVGEDKWVIHGEGDRQDIVETVETLDEAVGYVQRMHYAKLAKLTEPAKPRGKVCDDCGVPVRIEVGEHKICIRCDCTGSARIFEEETVKEYDYETTVREKMLHITSLTESGKDNSKRSNEALDYIEKIAYSLLR